MAAPSGEYTVTFVTEYGTTPQSVITQGYLTNLPIIEQNGATFLGWTYSDGTLVQEGDKISANTTLYAKWDVNQVLVNEPRLYAIADAIRSKNGSTTEYRPKDMADAISSLSTGGDSSGSLKVATGTMTAYHTSITGLGFTPKYVCIMAAKGVSQISMDASNYYLVSIEQGVLNGEQIYNQCIAYRSSGSIYGSENTIRRCEITFAEDGFVCLSVGNISVSSLSLYGYIAIG